MLLLHMAAEKSQTMINSSGFSVSGCGIHNLNSFQKRFVLTKKCLIANSLVELLKTKCKSQTLYAAFITKTLLVISPVKQICKAFINKCSV